MKELLIKIRALFEGRGISDAKNAVDGLNNTSNRAGGGLTRLQTCIDGAAAKAGIFGGAVTALGGQLLSMATGAVTSVVSGITSLAQGFVAGIKGATDFADSVSEMATRTGQSIETVLTLATAFKNAGMSSESVAPIMVRLQNALAGVNEEGKPASEAFAKLGLSMSEMRAMSADEQLAAIGAALRDVPDATERAALGMSIFGRAWAQVSSVVLDADALKVAKEQLGDLAVVIEHNEKAFGKFSDAWARLGDLKSQQFFTGAAAAFAGDMERAADAINRIDLTKIGMTLGTMVKDVGNLAAFISGPFVEAAQAVDKFVDRVGFARDAVLLFLSANPMTSGIGSFFQWFFSAMDRSEKQLADMKAQGEQAAQATANSAANSLMQTGDAAQQDITAAGVAAAQATADVSRQAQEQLSLTADQIKVATQQIAAAMTQANAEGVTPALTALTTAVQESFARITGELTSALATMQSAQAEQVPAFTEAVAQLTATMAASTEATTAATATIAQSVTASAEKTVAATQQSAQAINQAFGQISQAIVQSNQAMANGLSSLASSVSSSLANLQQQINAVAARIR